MQTKKVRDVYKQRKRFRIFSKDESNDLTQHSKHLAVIKFTFPGACVNLRQVRNIGSDGQRIGVDWIQGFFLKIVLR